MYLLVTYYLTTVVHSQGYDNLRWLTLFVLAYFITHLSHNLPKTGRIWIYAWHMWKCDTLAKMENDLTAITKWYKFIRFISLNALTKFKKASKMFCLILAVGLISSVSSKYNVCFELPITITTHLFLIYWLFVYMLRPIGECTVRVNGDLAIFLIANIEMKTKTKIIFYVVVSMKKTLLTNFWILSTFAANL